MYIVVGLGNPGDEYKDTRHNTGRMAVAFLQSADVGPLGKEVKFVHLETFMNKSGAAVAKVVKSKKAASKLIVLYDDLDLPLGVVRISYNRGSGGHKGIESIIKALGTREFIRVRIGVSPTTPGGKLKKPQGDKEVEKFILGEFKKSEKETLNNVFKRIEEAVRLLSTETLQKAMTLVNGQ